MPTRPVGTPGCEVSRLSLDSWRVFAPIAHEERPAVMRASRDAGFTGGVLARRSAAGITSPHLAALKVAGRLDRDIAALQAIRAIKAT